MKLDRFLASSQQFWQTLNQVNRHNIGSAPRSVQAVVIALVVSVIAMVAWLALISPSQTKRSALMSQEQSLMDEFIRSHRQLQVIEPKKAQLESESQALDAKLAQVPKSAPMTQIISMIHTQADQAGVQVLSATVQPMIRSSAPMIERPMMVVATGDYHALGRWLMVLDDSEYLLTMGDYELTADGSSNRLRLTMRLITYQVNDQYDAAKTAQGAGQ